MILEKAIKGLAWLLPLIFAFAFIVPVLDQGMQALGVPEPFGLSTLAIALIVGGAWGLIAQFSGRWI